MKKITPIVLMLAAILAVSTSANAVIPVTDAGSIAQQILSYSTQLSQYTNQVQQLQNQFQQLANEAQNLRNLNWQAPLSDLNNLAHLMENAQGIAASYSVAQAQFQKLYPDFNTYSGMSGASLVSQATAWQNQNRNAALDTMNLQAMLRDAFMRDRITVNDASNRSSGASGTRDLLQATNQLLAVVSKQLMQLESLLASTASLDASYAAQRASQDAAANAMNKSRFKGWGSYGPETYNSSLEMLH